MPAKGWAAYRVTGMIGNLEELRGSLNLRTFPGILLNWEVAMAQRKLRKLLSMIQEAKEATGWRCPRRRRGQRVI